jgi:hypothetical protein
MSNFSAEKILHRLPSGLLNATSYYRSMFSNSGYIAHHGIQRAGTNYLNICLKKVGVFPLNSFDPQRDSPIHKHFRWQGDKSSIPPFVSAQYGNDVVVDDLFQLNKMASYPNNCKHIVIIKDEKTWLASICNWGLSCGWFSTKTEALKNLGYLKKDYENYYQFWSDIALANQSDVSIIKLENLLGDFNVLLNSLDTIGVNYRVPNGFDGAVETVPMSPKGRVKSVTTDDILENL